VFISILLIITGVLLLLGGGEALLRGAVGLATFCRLSPAVIGLTVVAAGTSVPELAVSALAAFQGRTDMAVGNVVGSNIFNIAFILGSTALFRSLALSGTTLKFEYPALLLVTFVFIVLSFDGYITRLDGLLLCIIYLFFTAHLVRWARNDVSEKENELFVAEVRELSPQTTKETGIWLSIGFTLLGVVLLGTGAELTVRGAVVVGSELGMTERLIGLTILAGGTGLPELVTSLVSVLRGRDDIAVANVMGSNLLNILVILGVTAIVSPLAVSPAIVASDNWWLLACTLLAFPLMFIGRRIVRTDGVLLLVFYCVYLAHLLLRT